MWLLRLVCFGLGLAVTAGLLLGSAQVSAHPLESADAYVASTGSESVGDLCDRQAGYFDQETGALGQRYHCHCVTPHDHDVAAVEWHEVELPVAFERPAIAAAYGDGVSSAFAVAQTLAVGPPFSILFGNFRS